MKAGDVIYRYLDAVTLVILVFLLLLRLFVVKCSLLLCGAFVSTVVVWSVLSSHRPRMKDE